MDVLLVLGATDEIVPNMGVRVPAVVALDPPATEDAMEKARPNSELPEGSGDLSARGKRVISKDKTS